MPVIQVAPGPSGGGGGDATAANQVLQLAQDATEASLISTNSTLTQIVDLNTNAGGAANSVFKDNNQQSVFRDNGGIGASLIYKTTKNCLGLTGLLNQMICVSFTNTTAAAVAADLSTFLANNDCFVISVTSSQTALSHDLFLTYSI